MSTNSHLIKTFFIDKMHSSWWFHSSLFFAVSCVISFPINRSSNQAQGGYVNKPPAVPFDVPQWNFAGGNGNGVPQVFNFYNSYPTFTYQGCCHDCTGGSCTSNCGNTNTESSGRNLPQPLPLAPPQTYPPTAHSNPLVPHNQNQNTYLPEPEPPGLYLPPANRNREHLSPALTNIVLPLPKRTHKKHSKDHTSGGSEKHSKVHASDEPGKHTPKHSTKLKHSGHSKDMEKDVEELVHSNSTKPKNNTRRVMKHKVTQTHHEDASYESGETTENPNIVFDSTTTLLPEMGI